MRLLRRSDYGENSRASSSRSRCANSASRDLARRWPITRRVLKVYMEVVRGVDKRYAEWRTPTYRAVTV